MMIVSKEQVDSLFAMYRENLKAQAKRLSNYLSIKISDAYELIAIIWGFDSWYQLNKFLKQMHELYQLVSDMDKGDFVTPDGDLDLVNIALLKTKLECLDKLKMESDFSPDYVKRLDRISNEPDLIKGQSSSEMFEGINKAFVSFTSSIGIISRITGFYKDREAFSENFVEEYCVLRENLDNYKGDTTKFNIDNDPAVREYISEQLVKCMLGIGAESDKKRDGLYRPLLPSRSTQNLKGLDEEYWKLFLYGADKDITIQVGDLGSILSKVEGVDMYSGASIDASMSLPMSVATCIAQLPSDAIMTIGWSMDSGIGKFYVFSVTVKKESQLPRLLACGLPRQIRRFKRKHHDNLKLCYGDINLDEYENGYSFLEDPFDYDEVSED